MYSIVRNYGNMTPVFLILKTLAEYIAYLKEAAFKVYILNALFSLL